MTSSSSRKPSPAFVLLAAALLVFLVVPIALAGTGNGPQATAGANVKKKVKKLTQQANALSEEVDGSTSSSGT